MGPDPSSPLPPSAYGPPPTPPADDSLAWGGIAASIGSWLACCCTPIPFLGLLGFIGGLILSTAGTLCGAIAYRNAKRAGTRTDLALLALVIGGARLGLTLVALGMFLAIVAIVGFAGVAQYIEQAGHGL